MFQKLVLRRVSQILRGVLGWNLVKEDVNDLAKSAVPPRQVIYGDEFAMTQAWHAVRIWPASQAGMEVKT
jgi:hypothetical protein